jgi:hypothetical protein
MSDPNAAASDCFTANLEVLTQSMDSISLPYMQIMGRRLELVKCIALQVLEIMEYPP